MLRCTDSVIQVLKIVQNTTRPNQDFAVTGPCVAFGTADPGALASRAGGGCMEE